MHVLYVTSFAPDMYYATGAPLLESFMETGSEGSFLVAHEGQLGDVIARSWPTVLRHDLDSSAFLRQWLDQHRDIVPVERGGEATPCQCPGRDTERHEVGCHWDWYNRNACRWFRKIVALDHALDLEDWTHVVWLDSDCRFLQQVPAATICQVFGTSSMFYLRGSDRMVIESGIIGFKRDQPGLTLLRHVIDRYRSGLFRQDARWDDGYQFGLTVDEHPEAPSIDIATRSGDFDYVVPGSALGRHLAHFKGVHGPVLRLMR